MFKSREDINSTKTFDTSDDAIAFVSAVSSSLKSQGFTVSRMEVSESYYYGYPTHVPASKAEEMTEKKNYIGIVSAYKETTSDEAPVAVEKAVVN